MLAAARSLGRLALLDLSACASACTTHSVRELAEGCPMLHTLKCFGCFHLGDDGVAPLAARCGATLRRLDLSACDIGDASLHAIATHCSALRRLDVNGCTEVTDGALLRVLDTCLELHTLGRSNLAEEQAEGQLDATLISATLRRRVKALRTGAHGPGF